VPSLRHMRQVGWLSSLVAFEVIVSLRERSSKVGSSSGASSYVTSKSETGLGSRGGEAPKNGSKCSSMVGDKVGCNVAESRERPGAAVFVDLADHRSAGATLVGSKLCAGGRKLQGMIDRRPTIAEGPMAGEVRDGWRAFAMGAGMTMQMISAVQSKVCSSRLTKRCGLSSGSDRWCMKDKAETQADHMEVKADRSCCLLDSHADPDARLRHAVWKHASHAQSTDAMSSRP
jgi:hypothetical protein